MLYSKRERRRRSKSRKRNGEGEGEGENNEEEEDELEGRRGRRETRLERTTGGGGAKEFICFMPFRKKAASEIVNLAFLKSHKLINGLIGVLR